MTIRDTGCLDIKKFQYYCATAKENAYFQYMHLRKMTTIGAYFYCIIDLENYRRKPLEE